MSNHEAIRTNTQPLYGKSLSGRGKLHTQINCAPRTVTFEVSQELAERLDGEGRMCRNCAAGTDWAKRETVWAEVAAAVAARQAKRETPVQQQQAQAWSLQSAPVQGGLF